jgi:hypothetical protein
LFTNKHIFLMEPLYSMVTYLIVCITKGHAEDVGQI